MTALRKRPRSLLFFLLALVLAPVLVAAQSLSSADQNLLTQAQYQIKPDGSVWAPGAATPLSPSDLRATLSRLTGAQRLKALLQVDMILDQSGGKDNLTPAQTEQIKDILRQNWAYFTDGSRRDMSGYFEPEELAALNEQSPPAQEQDQAPEASQNSGPASESYPDSAPAPVGAAPSAATAPAAPAPPVPTLDESPGDDSSEALSVSAPPPALSPQISSAAAPAPAPQTVIVASSVSTAPAIPAVSMPQAVSASSVPIAAAVLPAPTLIPQVSSAPAAILAPQASSVTVVSAAAASASAAAALPAQVLPVPALPAPALPAPPTPQVMVVGASPQALKEMVALQAGPSPSTATAAGAVASGAGFQLFPLPLPPLPAAVSSADLEKLLQNAPYTQGTVYLLRLIAQKAGLGRDRALRFVLTQIPSIVIEPRRCVEEPRGCLEIHPNGTGGNVYTIVLNPGALIIRRGSLWTHQDYLLPDAPEFYAQLHLAPPDFKANHDDSLAQSTEDGPWGKTSVYSDGSRRGAYSREEMAGALLRELLLADAADQGWDVSSYYTQVYTRTAQEIFYAAVAQDAKGNAFLDAQERLMYRRWKNDPNSLRDELIHSLSAPRSGLSDFLGEVWDVPATQLSNATDCAIRFSRAQADDAKARELALKDDAAVLEQADLFSQAQIKSADEALSADAAASHPEALKADDCLRLQQRKEMGRRLALYLSQSAYEAQAAQAADKK